MIKSYKSHQSYITTKMISNPRQFKNFVIFEPISDEENFKQYKKLHQEASRLLIFEYNGSDLFYKFYPMFKSVKESITVKNSFFSNMRDVSFTVTPSFLTIIDNNKFHKSIIVLTVRELLFIFIANFLLILLLNLCLLLIGKAIFFIPRFFKQINMAQYTK